MAFHPVDVHVGLRMRQRRALLGMSQTSLGTSVGLTFQQVQKYERGSNRISASRLVEFARVLDVPVTFFFQEMPANAVRAKIDRNGKKAREEGTPFDDAQNPLAKRETLELVRAYYKIREPRVRKNIFEMVKALGKESHSQAVGRTGKSRPQPAA